MKKPFYRVLVVVIGAFVTCLSCACLPIMGNGSMITSEKPVSPFESIHVSGSAIVNYHQSREHRAVVTVDSNLDEYVRVYTQGGVLTIGTKKGSNCHFTQYMVDVYAPTLSGLSISGSANFDARDKITSQNFRLGISGSGKIKGAFECDDFAIRVSGSGDVNSHIVCNRFEIAVSGSGEIRPTGSCEDLDITVSGSGTITANEFEARNANIRVSGSGRIYVWVLDNLRANVSGSGRVRYRGNPKVDFGGSGSGRLESDGR